MDPDSAVRTVLPNPSTRPGLRLPGRVLISSGLADLPVAGLTVGLVTRVDPVDPQGQPGLVEFQRFPLTGGFVVPAGRRRAVHFAVPLPWETPVTVISGRPLLNLRTGLRTEAAVDPMTDRGELTPLYVHPLPAQAGILAAFDTLEFRLRQAGLQAGSLLGVAQTLPFHQRIGYWAAPLYAGPINEVEVTFVTNRYGVEVILTVDRRLALAGAGHFSLSRFRVWHACAEKTDWVRVVDGWIRQAIDRHADAASGYRTSTHLRESPQVSRPPEHVAPGRGDPDATAGGGSGIGGGGGGGDGT
ncbi:MAG TPA: sporulation protein [Micromonospora sp.]